MQMILNYLHDARTASQPPRFVRDSGLGLYNYCGKWDEGFNGCFLKRLYTAVAAAVDVAMGSEFSVSANMFCSTKPRSCFV